MKNRPKYKRRTLTGQPSSSVGVTIGPLLRRIGLLVAALLVSSGCTKPAATSSAPRQPQSKAAETAWRDEVFDLAIDTLNRLEEFDGTEMLQQAVNRLDRWVGRQEPPADWTADPFVAKLHAALTDSAEQIGQLAIDLDEVNSIDKAEKLRGDLADVVGRLEDLAGRFNELAELTYLSQFQTLAGNMNQLAEQLGTLAAGEGVQSPADLAEAVHGLIRQIGPEQLERLRAQLEEFAERVDVGKLAFSSRDQYVLREAVWLRNISHWAAGETLDDPLEPAIRLFDWTVRNIQLVGEPAPSQGGNPNRVLQKPWETLLLGRGTVVERVWVFLLLARQQRLEATLLAIADPEDPTGRQARPWAVGVLVDGELYLFEPVLGLPIPAPDGVQLEEGQLAIRPATLSQVADDDRLLRKLDHGPEDPYPVDSSQAAGVIAFMEASPDYLGLRMKLVESRLSGQEKLVLSTDSEVQAQRIRACAHVAEVRPWRLPYRTLFQEIELGPERLRWQFIEELPFKIGPDQWSPLWKGRTYQFKGIFTGDPSAVAFYLAARQSERELDAMRRRMQAMVSGLRDPRVAVLQEAQERAMRLAKMNASYWLGLIHAHLGNDRSAVDYFQKRTLAGAPAGPWTHGAVYNLARVHEAQGRFAQAIKLYRADTTAISYQGNFLRARWLESLTAEQADEPADYSTADPGKQSQTPTDME